MTDPLFIDIYAGDGRDADLVHRAASAGAPWHGIWFKATEGLSNHAGPWFTDVWRTAHGVECAHIRKRLGVDWWVSAYHFLLVHQDPAKQADFFLRAVLDAGGWTHGTMYPVVDVEDGAFQRHDASAQQIIDCTSAFVEKVARATGRDVVLYSGEWLRAKFDAANVHDRMGCKYIWPASYTAGLNPHLYTDVGFDRASLFAWQYNGDGDGKLAGYPHVTPLGPEDISAITIDGGGAGALAHLRARTWPVVR